MGALVLAMVVAAALVIHLTRGTTFWFDEWNWALYRRTGGLHSLLVPYNGHFSLIPLVIYRVLFATAGAGNYLPYRIMIVLGDLVCAGLLFLYVRRRVGGYLALLAALLILFLGPAWQNLLWPFQIAWLIALAAGMGAFLLLDRQDTPGDALACLLLIVSLASTSVGVAITVGTAVEIVLARRRLARAWIVAIPLGLYVIWSLGYQNTSLTASGVYAIWRTVVDSAAAALSAPLGLSGQTATDPRGTLLTFGFPLLLAAGGLLWWRGRRLGPWPTRAFALGAVLMTFWILIALERSTLGVSALAGRYLEVDALFALLLASELGRGLILRRSLAVALGVITAAALIANVGILRIGAAFLRVSATSVRAGLTGLSIARASVSPAYVSPILPAYPIVRIRAGAYFAMERAIGTPAYTVRQLAGAPLGVRSITDIQLVALGDIRVLTAPASASFGLAPSPAASSGMTVRRQGACLLARPWGPTTGPGGARLVLPVPRGGLLVKTTAPARVGVWRFGISPHNLAAPSTASDFVVRARPDAAARPWRLVLQTSGAATICGLGGT